VKASRVTRLGEFSHIGRVFWGVSGPLCLSTSALQFFYPIILFGSTTLLTGMMTGISLHMQWPLTSQSHGSFSQREQLAFCYRSNSTPYRTIVYNVQLFENYIWPQLQYFCAFKELRNFLFLEHNEHIIIIIRFAVLLFLRETFCSILCPLPEMKSVLNRGRQIFHATSYHIGKNTSKDYKICKMAIKCTNIFHFKAL
jgi:hypothetical protein